MTVTTTTAPAGEVDDLDPARLLASVTDAETAERLASWHKLELAAQWCVLHPATADIGAAVWGDSGLPGLTAYDETLGGDGCPPVAAFAPEPFAAALGVSTMTGMQLLADVLDLQFRLPGAWAKVRRLEVPAWKARRLAQATHHLSQEAAAQVDARLADRLDTCGSVLIDRTVAQAAAQFEPAAAADAEQRARDSWDVALRHRTDGGFAGTSQLEATGDTLDLTRFYDLVCDHADRLASLGDTDDLGARKVKALGVIADTQSHLDLNGPTPTDGPDPTGVRRSSSTRARFYLHVSLTDLLDDTVAIGELEKLGPLTLARIRSWLAGTKATIVPVLDLSRDDAVDQHDPPGWMRETVILRDRHCVFPWCRRDARSCDLDHIEPYVAMDDGGPPGQTAPSALAPLCRRHHRVKTSGHWRYSRRPDGTFVWHGPHGLTHLVTRDTTVRV